MISIAKKLFSSPVAILVIVLVALAFIVRTIGLADNNVLFLFDSARDFLWVKKIVADFNPILIGPSSGGLQGYFHGVIWYYILAIPFVLSGGHPISGPWFMAIMSTLSVVASFFILKKTMNTYAGILGLLFLGFSGYSVATAKFIWNPYPIVWLMPFYFLGIYLFVKRSRWGLLLISLVQGLLLHFEVIYGLGMLPAYLLYILFYFKFPAKKTNKLKNLLIALVLFAVPMLSSALFDVRNDFLISRSLLNTLSTGGSNLSHKEGEVPSSITQRLQLRFNDLSRFSINSVTENKYVNYGLFVLLVAGVVFIARDKKKKQEKYIVILAFCGIISPFFVFLLLRYSVWGYYWIGTSPFYAMFLAFGIGYLAGKLRKPILFAGLVALILLVYSPWKVLPYWHKGELIEGREVLSTQLKVVDAIYKDANGETFSVYQQTPPVYDYVYRYLFWWKGSSEHKFVPTDEKQKQVYLILEGVPEDLKATYFKEHTIHLTGQPVKKLDFGSTWPTVEKYILSSPGEPVDPNFFPPL